MLSEQNKCTRYWPELDNSKAYGKISVCCLKETTKPHYVLREFVVNKDSDDAVHIFVIVFFFNVFIYVCALHLGREGGTEDHIPISLQGMA